MNGAPGGDMVGAGVDGHPARGLILHGFQHKAVFVVGNTVKLAGGAHGKQAVHAVVNQVIHYLTQYGDIHLAFACKGSYGWGNNPLGFERHNDFSNSF
ncbi:hypothetical protein SDC9_165696 [bioreactor metagenome]|uniref:Uncharacterized protein n=1 Tax=bioreactor metagenome TaxID=1076179 RepID=A0A645FWT9_9ZZZZ